MRLAQIDRKHAFIYSASHLLIVKLLAEGHKQRVAYMRVHRDPLSDSSGTCT